MAVDNTKKYYYSEVFTSIQGEGAYTGQHTLWLRYFMCNLQCNGFGQLDPTNPETYDLPFEDFDVSTVSRVEDLPVWDKGCDSSYTWAKKYKHLMGQRTPAELVQTIMYKNSNSINLSGKFLHPRSGQRAHMCFTGGEPLMRTSQKCSKDILEIFRDNNNEPGGVTFETNGTQKLTQEFKDFMVEDRDWGLFWSVSPKLWSVAGEKADKAIKPEIVKEYMEVSDEGQLKFVVGNKLEQWDELEHVITQFRKVGIDWPVYIMPVGATLEGQDEVASEVAWEALKRGYNVSARAHVYLFGNQIGT